MIHQPQNEIIILGMHRSGTSMVCGVLNQLGVDFGEDYPGRQISNPLGHFEDGDFLHLNEAILAAAGGSWNHPPEDWAIKGQVELFQEQIRDLVSSRIETHYDKPWGWKDPRTSLTIELYLPYLACPYFIWCQRDPNEIAASLSRRNKFNNTDGLALVDTYQQRITEFVKRNPEFPLITLSYHDMIAQPEFWVNSLAEFLNLDPGKEQFERAVKFILPRKKIKREKMVVRWKYWISLPSRAIKRFLLNR